MSDSVEKCLIDLIDLLNRSFSQPHSDNHTSEDHFHFALNIESVKSSIKIKERLQKLGETNDIHSKTG